MPKIPNLGVGTFCGLLRVSLQLALAQGLHAAGADVLPMEDGDAVGLIAEDAGGLILLQHDGLAVHVNLQTVLLCNVQGAAEFNGEHDASQLVHLTHDTGRFHTTKSFLFS